MNSNINRELHLIKSRIEKSVAGIWIPEHDARGHKYRHSVLGVSQYSVTTKLQVLDKPRLKMWMMKMAVEWMALEDRWKRFINNPSERDELITGAQLAHTDKRDDAGDVGTQAHNIMERFINEWIANNYVAPDIMTFVDPSKTDPRAIACVRGLQAVLQKHRVIPIASELLVGHHKYSAGTLDFLCFWDDKLTLVDFKTSNGIDNIGYSLQVSAYVKFFTYMTGIRIPSAKIIHFSKGSDKFDVYKVNRITDIYKVFKALCTVWDWVELVTNGNKKGWIAKDIKKLIIK